ncbi:MAG: ABC transporter ATP-binding protein [Candidatus Lokiarchaeota archaeon]|nr:ABC transporter ATP-binding protein [Candidatus Lokiarchaeota archaeon]
MPEKENSPEIRIKENLEKENEKLIEANFIEEIDKNHAIVARNIFKDYEIGNFIVRAVEDVSLSIYSGEFLVIKGPSGAGKTSLLNLLGGLDSPKSGIIYSFGVKISDMEEESLSTWRLLNSGFVFQNYNLISTLTAEENVMFPMNLSGVEFKAQRKRALELLIQMGLKDRREHLPFQLSAGEQQRIAIARALANNPPIIIADEPTANLDKKTSKFIRDLFKDLKNSIRTIIIATHDDYLINLADTIISFDDGKIINKEIINNNKN